MYELTGTLKLKYDTVKVSDTFKKREFIVEVLTQTSKLPIVDTILFQSTQDKTSLLDSINVGDSIQVKFNVRGKGWQKPGTSDPVRYFNNLEAWSINKVDGVVGSTKDEMPIFDDDNDSLPF